MSDFRIHNEASRSALVEAVNKLDVSKPWTVKIGRETKQRSLNANALLHKWIGLIADETGDDLESTKADLKRMFARQIEHTSKLTGKTTMESQHTSDMTTQELSEFMEKIRAFAGSHLAMRLPSPEDRDAA